MVHSCEVEGHSNNPLNLVCTSKKCEKRGIICSNCLLQEHNDHVKQCLPLKEIINSLTVAQNSFVSEEMRNNGCEILKQHKQIVSGFKEGISKIMKRIEEIESAIETHMSALIDDAEIFLGDSLELLLYDLNTPSSTYTDINYQMRLLLPFFEPKQGFVDCLNEELRKNEMNRVTEKAKILSQEALFWIQKCEENVSECVKRIKKISSQQISSQIKSENRFGQLIPSWILEGNNSITFQPSKTFTGKDFWLIGIGHFEINSITKEPSTFTVSLGTGSKSNQANLMKQVFRIEAINESKIENHIGNVFFENGIKLIPENKYTLTVSVNQQMVSFAGMNGISITDDISYFDSVFETNMNNNGTNSLIGQIPYLIYEIR